MITELKNNILKNSSNYDDFMSITKEAIEKGIINDFRDEFVNEIILKTPVFACVFPPNVFKLNELISIISGDKKEAFLDENTYVTNIRRRSLAPKWISDAFKISGVGEHFYEAYSENLYLFRDNYKLIKPFIKDDFIRNIVKRAENNNKDKDSYDLGVILHYFYKDNLLTKDEIRSFIFKYKTKSYSSFSYSNLKEEDKILFAKEGVEVNVFNFKHLPFSKKEELEYLIDFEKYPLLSEFINDKESKSVLFWKTLINKEHKVLRFVPIKMLNDKECFSDDYYIFLFKNNLIINYNGVVKSKNKLIRFLYERAEKRFNSLFIKKLNKYDFPENKCLLKHLY